MARIRRYESDDVTVTYDVKRCLHAEECVHGLPEVFDPERRPWVSPGKADADAVARIVERCPTGALHYERHDGGPAEEAPEPLIRLAPDGPLYVQGRIELRAGEGTVRWTDTRAALCRCGASKIKPFCDDSHRDIDFRTETPS